MIKTTNQQKKFWKERSIDWKKDYQCKEMIEHPHRRLITWILKSIQFHSLWEVGVGGGANLIRIAQDIPNKQLGGSDVNPEAIALLKETFTGGMFHVESGDDMMMSDNSLDVILTDMCLIYVDPRHIDKYLKEFYRVGRNYIVLVEFHSNSWWKRMKARLGGYHVYDYRKRLERIGYYDIMVQKIPEEYWPGTDQNTEFRSIITARI
jgi:ubiquinone/menaquinone biosynthesis C-methylase UbiE